MFADCLDNPLFSDVSIVLKGGCEEGEDDIVLRGHKLVLTRYSKEYFEAVNRYSSSSFGGLVGRKRKACHLQQDVATIHGWNGSQRAARDLVEFMYCAFDMDGSWADRFFEETDSSRVWNMVCTADAYCATKVVDVCVDYLTCDDPNASISDWKAFFAMPNSVIRHKKVDAWLKASLSDGPIFQRVYVELAEACPVDLAVHILESDNVQVWSEDVMLEFVMRMCDTQKLERKDAAALMTKVRVVHLTPTGLMILAQNSEGHGSISRFVHMLLIDEAEARKYVEGVKTLSAWVLPPRKSVNIDTEFTMLVDVVNDVNDDDTPSTTNNICLISDGRIKMRLPFVDVYPILWKDNDGTGCRKVGVYCKPNSKYTSVPGKVAYEISWIDPLRENKRIEHRATNCFTGRNGGGCCLAKDDAEFRRLMDADGSVMVCMKLLRALK